MNVASVNYTRPIRWAGVVMIMEDGSKRAIEFRHPRHALLRVEGGLMRELYGDPEIHFEISGYAGDWGYGEEAEPSMPVAEIGDPVREIEHGR